MSRLATGILGTMAVSLALGAAQLASGRDLSAAMPDDLPNALTQPLTAANAVNRTAKADRAAGTVGSPAQTRTISLRLDGFSDTSFLVRIPVAGGSSSAPPPAKFGDRKMAVACEPVVSVLTEIAKRLQPGRCVT